jgi:hypothetical protein
MREVVMMRRWLVMTGAIGLIAAGCGAGPNAAATPEVALICTPQQDPGGRSSPYDSVAVEAGTLQAKICYGRPSARGRTMLGGESVPYGKLWRTGANEPTIIHLAAAAESAGIAVEPGSYSLYTIPGEKEWTVIVNRSITQWGHESSYRDEVEADEVGRATVSREEIIEPVETFTIRAETSGDGAARIFLEWETTRIGIPLAVRPG